MRGLKLLESVTNFKMQFEMMQIIITVWLVNDLVSCRIVLRSHRVKDVAQLLLEAWTAEILETTQALK